MAILKIYNDIQTEEQKNMMSLFGGVEGVCYKDIDTFCDQLQAEDEEIDIRLKCDGGSVSEGWAMYDRLRSTGKDIHVTIEGATASMATIIAMAAPKEQRKALPNAQICVHNPWVATQALGVGMTADELQDVAEDMRREQKRLVDLYVERCGCTAEEIQTLMNEDKYISATEAMNYGIIGGIIPPMSASKKNNSIMDNMAEKSSEKVEVKRSIFDRILAKFGKKHIEEIAYAMDLDTADGQKLYVEREEGAPQVGDAASPDGDFTMPDGSVIKVADGVIVEIVPPATENEAEEKKEETEAEADVKDEAEVEIEKEHDDDRAEVERLISENEDLKARIAELEEQLAEATKNAKTNDDLYILNAVKMAGGKKALKVFESDYKPEHRSVSSKKAEEHIEDKVTKEAILAKIKENKAKQAKKK